MLINMVENFFIHLVDVYIDSLKFFYIRIVLNGFGMRIR